MGKKFLLSLIFISFLSLSGFGYLAMAQVTVPDKQAQQAELQRQLEELQAQIADIQGQLKETTAQKNTLQNKINALQKQQQALNLQIQATNLQVANIGEQITETETFISQNSVKVKSLKQEIAGYIRAINQNDNKTFLYTAMGKGKLSDLFSAYQEYAKVSDGLNAIAKELNRTNSELEIQKQNLSMQQDDAENLLSLKAIQQEQLVSSVAEQNNLLKTTKGKETDYQIALNDTKARASEISGRIYQLLGISGQVTFGKAYELAVWANGATGIDPAFLLAVITQESNLGKNVGTCNRPGDGPEKSYKVMMKPDRDIKPFLEITESLGLDAETTPISCAMKDKNGKTLGWGGAMGPAQFIPSTWMGYKDKVSKLTGNYPANPWDIRDAFAAAAIKLVAGGADGTYQGNWNAAMRYFSGGTNVAYRFYGDNVMNTAEKYQSDIDALSK